MERLNKNFIFKFILVISIIFFLNVVSAAEINDTFHLNIQTTFANGSIQNGTFVFAFNITESSSASCGTPIVYNYSTTKTTDSRGITSIYLPQIGTTGNLSNLNYDRQYYLCYYRDGTLKDVTQLSRVPYSFRATQVNLSEVTINSNLTLGNFNISGSSGFFSFLGSLANRITTLFVGNINATGSIVTNDSLTINSSLPSGSLIVGNLTNTQLFVNGTSGRVGIGTTSPNQTLDVVGSGIRIAGSGRSDGLLLSYDNFGGYQISTQNNTGNIGILSNSSLLLRYATTSANTFLIQKNTTDYVFSADSNGRIGINTSTPQNTLNVVGDLNVTGTSYLGNIVLSAQNITVDNLLNYSAAGINIPNNLTIGKNLTVDSGTLFVDSVNNRVGIGTTSPNQSLDVFGNITFNSSILAPNGSLSIPAYSFDSSKSTGIFLVAGGMSFVANGSQSFTVSSANGDVSLIGNRDILIGNSGQIRADDSGNSSAPAYAFNTDSNTGIYSGGVGSSFIGFSIGGSNKVSINGSNFGIGTTTPKNTLNVVGDLNVTNNVTLLKNLTIGSFAHFDSDRELVSIGTVPSSSYKFQIIDTGTIGTLIRTGSTLTTSVNGEEKSAIDIGNSYTIGTHTGIIARALRITTTGVGSGGNFSELSNIYLTALSTPATLNGTNRYAINIGNVIANNFTNAYALYIASVISATNNWAIYSDASAPSYFAGSIGIGTTTPQQALNVFGSINSTTGFIVNSSTGVTANYSVGTCWIAYKGGIAIGSNCTAF